MFKPTNSKQSSPFSTGWLTALLVSTTGLLLTVSSMDYAPIMPVKLPIAALFLTGIAVSSRQLSYRRTARRRKLLTAHKQQYTQRPDVAA